jgi:hypothetical protein
MVDIVAGLAAAGQALKIVKELNEVDRQLDQATLKLRIAELSGSLATAQIALADAQQALRGKDDEIATLRRNFQDARELVEYDGFWFRSGADGKPRGRPYCPKCYRRGVLSLTVFTLKEGRPYDCPECGGSYQMTSFPFDE